MINYDDMSIDELFAHHGSEMNYKKRYFLSGEIDRRRAARDAILDLAEQLDAEGLELTARHPLAANSGLEVTQVVQAEPCGSMASAGDLNGMRHSVIRRPDNMRDAYDQGFEAGLKAGLSYAAAPISQEEEDEIMISIGWKSGQ